ncbi:MAG: discoidin domain-containing protein, partial [Planctomycetota bacterium]
MVHQPSRPYFLGIFVSLLFVAVPGYAVDNVKVSNYGGGHQIWFEVEDFDERDPADDSSFALSDEPGAFGRTISSVNGSDGNGMIRYDFDISKAGGSGGTWYFWGRVINPNNNSDFMLVDGHPGDQVPFTQPVTGLVNSQRIFEQSGLGNDWVWAPTEGSAGEESHTKTLRDGENTMYVISREAGATWDVFMWTDDPDYVPTNEDYENATAPVTGAASNPSPAGGAIDVPRDVTLGWTPGEGTVARDVYFGTVFEDVNGADRANPLDVLVSQAQDATIYELPAVLEFGQTYYWRIDEVNAAPDSTIFKGSLWSFTVEPFAYPVENVLATAFASDAGMGPENTVNGSGLDADDLHSVEATDMWLATGNGVDPVWLQYEFDRVYKLHEMLVWNYNVMFELVLGFGLKDVTVEYSVDGVDWMVLADVEFAQGTAMPGYAANTVVDMAGVAAKFVRVTVSDNWGMLTQYGLSEVRFTYLPVHPREPMPVDGEADVSVNATLEWRAGREAASHEVYFGMDEAAVADGTALVDTVAAALYDPAGLDFGQTYYWKIVEVNEVETPAAWEGDVWEFSTQEYFMVEDFESYDDEENRIFDTWLDGFVNDTGSTVGYFEAPFAETTITHGGRQSMPLEY